MLVKAVRSYKYTVSNTAFSFKTPLILRLGNRQSMNALKFHIRPLLSQQSELRRLGTLGFWGRRFQFDIIFLGGESLKVSS